MENEITITFTEEDRQKADQFTNGDNCLVATALKRMGFEKVRSYLYTHKIDQFTYFCPTTSTEGLCAYPLYPYRATGPFYRPEIVGRQITLVRKDNAEDGII